MLRSRSLTNLEFRLIPRGLAQLEESFPKLVRVMCPAACWSWEVPWRMMDSLPKPPFDLLARVDGRFPFAFDPLFDLPLQPGRLQRRQVLSPPADLLSGGGAVVPVLTGMFML